MKNTLIALLILFATNAAATDFPTFMTGSWRSTAPSGLRSEEHWTDADGGLMLGVHRDGRVSSKTSFEFLRIAKRGDSLVYFAMPGGRPATEFPLKSLTETRVVFENPEHDFPQRIIYWLDGKKLCARVEGTMDGKEQGEQWCWSRIAL